MYYIGIEDLVANAMIEILEKSRNKELKTYLQM